jgi:alpha-2-macroglobulin
MLKGLTASVAVLFFILVPLVSLAVEPQVEMFSPEGTVKEVRQVTARFSVQMVSFGDPRSEDPFDVKCSEKGRGRWVDGKTWSYDFEKDLHAGAVCSFALKGSVRTLTGETLAGRKAFFFNTGGPSVVNIEPWEDNQAIQQDQAFIVTLDTEADEKSVLRHVYCSVEGIRERVGIRLIQENVRRDILKATGYEDKKEPVLVVQCRQTFPPRAQVKIVWGKGVVSKGGVSTSEDQVLSFRARGPFEAKLRCLRERPKAGCIPVTPMELRFTAPVPLEAVKKATLKADKGKSWQAKPGDNESKEFADSVIFDGPFPENTWFTLTLPPQVRDDSGRPLSNQKNFPLHFKTDPYPPLAKFTADFGILEFSAQGAALPLTVRNIEAQIKTLLAKAGESNKPSAKSTGVPANKDGGSFGMMVGSDSAPQTSMQAGEKTAQSSAGTIRQLRAETEENVIKLLNTVEKAQREKSILKGKENVKRLTIPKPGGSKEFEVIGIPFTEPGFYVVEVESAILGAHLLEKGGPMYVPSAALVTNMAAHFKIGRKSSIVWVTSLDKGQPVKDASIHIRSCSGNSLWQGKTDGDGIAHIPTTLPTDQTCASMGSEYGRGLFAFARKDGDMTFTHSSWRNGIEPWRFNLPRGSHYRQTDVLAHTIFDRTLLKRGETINMKHVLREGSTRGIVIPKKRTEALDEVLIEHVGSEQEYRLPLDWRADGTAESAWMVPSGAKLGTYNVFFVKKAPDAKSRYDDRVFSGSFRVEEFRVPLAKGFIQGPKDPLVAADEIEVDVGVNYLAGGAAGLLPVKIRSEAHGRLVKFSDYERYVFANGKVKEGVTRPEPAESYQSDDEEEGDEQVEDVVKKEKPQTIELKLDEHGVARTKITGIQPSDTPKDMLVELEFRDPNGEVQTSSTKIPIYPSKVITGISMAQKRATINEDLPYRVAVLDLQGKPAVGREVRVDILQIKEYSHRRRITGGFYAYEDTSEVKRLGTSCEGKTDQKGVLACQVRPKEGGSIILQAETKDESDRVSVTHQDVWVAGDDRWFEGRNDDRMDVLPEKREYQAGETARFQVKMPYQEATALVTVEREGVIDTYVRRLSRKDPFVEIPVKANYSPNAFVSVLALRGRLGEAKPTALFDPGKPSYKLGISEIKVGWQPHELKVKVLPAKEVYKTRDTVDVSLQVASATGRALPKGTEAAIAVIDEGLLELKSNDSWKLLESIMRKRPYEVGTSTAQMMIVGKRHFGKKAFPHGGGGGRASTRELFDALVYWNGRVPIDENGRGKVSFKLNDSLTSFKIVAITTGGADLFGTGDATIRSTQDLMMLSGLPPLVREGDKFRAGFTVRNTSQRAMDVEAAVVLTVGKERREMKPIRQHLDLGQAQDVGWDVMVPFGETAITYEASVKERGGSDAGDRLSVTQKVAKTVPVRVYQATLAQVKEPLTVQVERSADALSGQGGIQVVMKPKIADGLAGVTRYMRDYPYGCLEQKVSKAVSLRDRGLWDGIMSEFSSYLDGDGLAKYFPLMTEGDDILTSYVLALSHESDYPLPLRARERMIKALSMFVQGKVKRQYPLPMADLTLRKIAALEALSRFNAMPEGALDSINVEPNLWPNSAVIDWIGLLLRTPGAPQRDARLQRAKSILRSRLNLQGTVMTLSTRRDEAWWLMLSPEVDMVKAVLASLQFPEWEEDVPRMVRGALSRMHRGHWGTTPANVWGVLAMEKFSAKFESETATGRTTAALGRKEEAVDWAKATNGQTMAFPWPKAKETMRVSHQGSGRPWATIQSLAAIPWKQPFSSGYNIKKKIIPIERKAKDSWAVGDVMRVHLEIDAQSDMTWVVVNDPIPAGSTILGGGLGRDSSLLASQAGFEKGWAWEAYRERAFEGLRAYFQYVPKGVWTVEYVLRLNNVGDFLLPETRVEALYSPEMFGVLPNKAMEVKP